jgi:hypothetical protein
MVYDLENDEKGMTLRDKVWFTMTTVACVLLVVLYILVLMRI